MASPFQYKQLEFPVGGVNRKNAYQNQPPYTCMDALNVRPGRIGSHRMAGGSRPGIRGYVAGGMDDGMKKVNLLSSARGKGLVLMRKGQGDSSSGLSSSVDYGTITDDFQGSALSQSNWSALTGFSLPFVSPNPPNGSYGSPVGAAYKQFSYSTSNRHHVSMQIAQLAGKSSNGRYTLFAGLDNSAPASTQGISATIILTSDGVSYEIRKNGTVTETGEIDGGYRYGLLQISILPTESDNIVVSYQGSVFTSLSASLIGTRFGFALEAEDAGDVAAISFFQIRYYTTSISLPSAGDDGDMFEDTFAVMDSYAEIPIAGCDGKLYKSDVVNGEWMGINNSVKVAHPGYVMCQQRLTDLFVADWGRRKDSGGNIATGTDGTITGGVLTAASVSDWTDFGIVADSDVVTISDVTGATAGTYKVSAVASGGLTLQGYTGSDGTGTWVVQVSPKVLNMLDDSFGPWMASVGEVPSDCPLICLYRDRVVLAGAEDSPHLWYMSRQGDPYDWNYTEDTSSPSTDAGIAVAGQNSDAGVIGLPIRALAPHSDDYLVFGYDSQLWILRGDPAAGGQIDCISRTVGIAGKRAWCHGPSGDIVFLSFNGLHRLAAGGTSLPEIISYAKIPNELVGLSWTDNIQLSYDRSAMGVHIFVEGRRRNWFFSFESQSFWPVEYADGTDVTAMGEYGTVVLMGCADGFVRMHDERFVTDNGVPFDSKVLIGPVRMGRDDYGRGVLQRMDSTVCGSADGEGLDIRLFVSDEPIQAAGKYDLGESDDELVIRHGVRVLMTRRGGGAMFALVSQSGLMEWWGMERLGAYLKATGRFRE